MNRLLIAFCIGLSLCVAPVSMIFAAPPVAGQPVLVVTSPWTSAAGIVAAADGRIVGLQSAPLADIAYSESPHFVTELKHAGAWLVLDGTKILQICGIKL